jgi:hypothetical protein
MSPSTPAGSTWSRSKSACSAANASTAASVLGSACNPKSSLGNDSEMQHAPYQMDVHNRQGPEKIGRAYPRQIDVRRAKLKKS